MQRICFVLLALALSVAPADAAPIVDLEGRLNNLTVYLTQAPHGAVNFGTLRVQGLTFHGFVRGGSSRAFCGPCLPGDVITGTTGLGGEALTHDPVRFRGTTRAVFQYTSFVNFVGLEPFTLPDTGDYVGPLTFTEPFSMTGVFRFDFNNPFSRINVNVSGEGIATYHMDVINPTGTGPWYSNSDFPTIVEYRFTRARNVPEPSLAILGGVAFGAWFVRRRRASGAHT